MPSLRVAKTIPFPESTEHLSFHFGAEGRRALAIDRRSGRTTFLLVDPDGRAVTTQALRITIAPEHLGALELERGRVSFSAAHDRVVIWTDRARVHGLPHGEVLAEIDHVPGRCVCMSPDGRWLVSLEEERGWTLDVTAASPSWSGTGVFHQREAEGWTPREEKRDDEGNPVWDDEAEEPEPEGVYLDHVDTAVAIPWWGEPKIGMVDEGMFWLLAGCYGFAQSHLAIPSFTGWMLGRVVGESREFGGLVYDPIDLLQPAGARHVLVTHGSGAGLVAVDPATGESFPCRVRSPGHPYGFFRGVAPCATAPMAWVRCADGDFLWRFGHAPEPMPAAPGHVVALYPDALLCATADGLAWVEMPQSSAVEPGAATANPGSPPPSSEPAATDTAFVEVDGCRLAYSVRGDGPPVLMIQGVGLHGEGWRPQVDALADRYRCLTFDNRGVGRSRPAGAEVSVERMARDALALMDARGWASAHVVGHSLGGLVALGMALRAPERVRSLALLCTFARGSEAARSARMMWIGMRTRVGTRRMRRRAFLEIILPPEMLAGADREALAAELAPLFGHDLGDPEPATDRQLAAMRAYDAAPRLGELAGIPTLVVSAEHDPIAPPELGRALAAGIAGARYVEIARASHGVPIHDAARINQLLAEHLAAAEAARPMDPPA